MQCRCLIAICTRYRSSPRLSRSRFVLPVLELVDPVRVAPTAHPGVRVPVAMTATGARRRTVPMTPAPDSRESAADSFICSTWTRADFRTSSQTAVSVAVDPAPLRLKTRRGKLAFTLLSALVSVQQDGLEPASSFFSGFFFGSSSHHLVPHTTESGECSACREQYTSESRHIKFLITRCV